MIGGWKPLDLNSKEVQNLGMKIVEKYNSESDEDVKFNKVSNALQQISSKTNYRLIIQTTLIEDNGKTGKIKYLDAGIFQQPGSNIEEIDIKVLKPFEL
ncbi:Proteinase inhibitor I25, cystatin domain-containing protein [Strongyloides ratti]|uniref:Proteinase inhibitor I25, cystatin domain-containing protein n=1 Tax=Strongyloides ratti TaxID=34506 RepID=A0A090LLL2_STRRB|nr:Proteinase inhibitor I25, cystatin domain-containing protein [Strongyloides ratti]CEF70610.1 Proteinase inhibitor I25, cystatin domain-containing protein [Strongyloides ratti]